MSASLYAVRRIADRKQRHSKVSAKVGSLLFYHLFYERAGH